MYAAPVSDPVQAYLETYSTMPKNANQLVAFCRIRSDLPNLSSSQAKQYISMSKRQHQPIVIEMQANNQQHNVVNQQQVIVRQYHSDTDKAIKAYLETYNIMPKNANQLVAFCRTRPDLANISSLQANQAISNAYNEPIDDPTCLYILACFGFFFWIIGAIGMCCYHCGSRLPPRQSQAFKVLVAMTLLGIAVNIVYYFFANNYEFNFV
eukprot:451908_1